MNYFKKIKNFFFLDSFEKDFVIHSKNKWKRRKINKGELLLDIMAFPPYIFQSSYISNFLSSEYDLSINGIFPKVRREILPLSKFFYYFSKLNKLYCSFGCFSCLDYSYNSFNKSYMNKAMDAISRIKSKEDVLKIEIDGIVIGDLVYDSYLRRYSCATVDLTSDRLVNVLTDSLIIYHKCKDYLLRHDVRCVVLSHAVYVEYGILARLAVLRDIPVYLFSKWNTQVVHKLDRNHYLQTSNHLDYRKRFIELDNKKNRLIHARKILSARMAGEIDPGTSYMKRSAYSCAVDSSRYVFREGQGPRVLIMLHCFYDSPHIYRNMLFADFYEWLDYTLSSLEKTDFDVYVKPHPNGLPGNEIIVRDFEKKFPNVSFLEKGISNNKLLMEGVNAVITVYGTVAHEFAYRGVPVVCAGDNPHAAYDFCYTPTSKEEYNSLLLAADSLQVNSPKSSIEEFFYMHYLAPGCGRLEGNNDLFGMGRPEAERTVAQSSVYSQFLSSSNNGEFRDVPDKLRKALSQFSSFR